VKNLTVSLPDDVYRRARIRAAEADTSVSALVRKLLIEHTQEESEFDRRKRLQAEVLGQITDFRAGDRLSREDIHARGRK
jgi:plasmid stability protein